jgi:hypothetical protein
MPWFQWQFKPQGRFSSEVFGKFAGLPIQSNPARLPATGYAELQRHAKLRKI